MRSLGVIGPRSAIRLGVFVTLMLAVRPAVAVRIGVFADPNASSCGLQVQAPTPVTFYVLAVLDDARADGIVGAEFRITGFPGSASGWFLNANWTAPATKWPLGNPMFDGTDLALWPCQRSANRIVELGRISGFVTSSVTNVVVRVEGHLTPSNDDFSCPYVTLCDSADACGTGIQQPQFTRVCVEGLESIINGDPCTVDADVAGLAVARLRVAPNPAHRGAVLSFDQGRPGMVRIVVYDLAGRQVRDLSRAPAAGRASVLWDGRDAHGTQVASGVYFIEVGEPGRSPARARVTLLQ